MQWEIPRFKQTALLTQAMTHKSFGNEELKESNNNERLEFLGDAILTFLCGEYLYKQFPHQSEGELTPLRASLVDKTQLAEFAQLLRLDQRIRMGRGVENSGGRQNPRLLSSAFEALVGAYFLDQDSNVDVVRTYVQPFFEAALGERQKGRATINYKSQLQEWSLGQFAELPEYVIVAESGPDHAKHFEAEVRIRGAVYGRGVGRKKQEAEKAAASAALEKLGLSDRISA